MKFSTLVAAGVVGARALDNGLGRTPQMGWNSWYDVLMSPTAERVLATATALKALGLQQLGYHYVNLDDGMVSDRFPNGTLMPDPTGFPNGFIPVAAALHEQGFLFGVYTDRGPKCVPRRRARCARARAVNEGLATSTRALTDTRCPPPTIPTLCRTCGGRPAAQGNEALDAQTYASWGVDYVKARAL